VLPFVSGVTVSWPGRARERGELANTPQELSVRFAARSSAATSLSGYRTRYSLINLSILGHTERPRITHFVSPSPGECREKVTPH
jgi:hypothetical protein